MTLASPTRERIIFQTTRLDCLDVAIDFDGTPVQLAPLNRELAIDIFPPTGNQPHKKQIQQRHCHADRCKRSIVNCHRSDDEDNGNEVQRISGQSI